MRNAMLNILLARDPQLAQRLAAFDDPGQLTREDRERVVEILLDELGENGLDAQSEPTPYRMQIEEMIGSLAAD